MPGVPPEFSLARRGDPGQPGHRLGHGPQAGASLHLDRVVGVLGWHLREGTTAQFDRLQILAKVITAFWPVRLQRSDKDFNRRFVVTIERVKFHDLHRFLAITLGDQRLTPCGTACPPGPDY